MQSIEFFLAKTVTHFVTDKSIDRDGNLLNLSPSPLYASQANTPSPAPKASSSILLSNDLNNSDEKATSSQKPKSRADAMVQRARTTTTQQQPVTFLPIEHFKSIGCSSLPGFKPTPMQLAHSRGTPIWNTDYTLKFLDKVSLSLKLENQSTSTKATHQHHHHHHHHKTANVKSLNGDFIKIESIQKHYRPYYQEFTNWPTINFNCSVCPFQLRSDKGASQKIKKNNLNKAPAIGNIGKTVSKPINSVSISHLAKNNIASIIDGKMTRKTRNKQVRDSVDACGYKTNNDDVNPNSEKCGYCEKCRIEYDVLSLHLQSKEHLNFVKNNDNYIALDNLINSGTNVETFLRLNSSQVINDSDTNGIRSPKRETIAPGTRVNYLRHNSFDEITDDDDVPVKGHKQTNGTASYHEGAKLPKYSPPITRRSQTKHLTHIEDEDDTKTVTVETNGKLRSEFDLKEDEENVFLKTGKHLRLKKYFKSKSQFFFFSQF